MYLKFVFHGLRERLYALDVLFQLILLPLGQLTPLTRTRVPAHFPNNKGESRGIESVGMVIK